MRHSEPPMCAMLARQASAGRLTLALSATTRLRKTPPSFDPVRLAKGSCAARRICWAALDRAAASEFIVGRSHCIRLTDAYNNGGAWEGECRRRLIFCLIVQN